MSCFGSEIHISRNLLYILYSNTIQISTLCLLSSRPDFTVHTNTIVNYEISQYYPPLLFTHFQTRLHCTYKIWLFITKSFNIILHICLLISKLSDFTVHTNMFVHYEILQYYPPHLFTHIKNNVNHTDKKKKKLLGPCTFAIYYLLCIMMYKCKMITVLFANNISIMFKINNYTSGWKCCVFVDKVKDVKFLTYCSSNIIF